MNTFNVLPRLFYNIVAAYPFTILSVSAAIQQFQ